MPKLKNRLVEDLVFKSYLDEVLDKKKYQKIDLSNMGILHVYYIALLLLIFLIV